LTTRAPRPDRDSRSASPAASTPESSAISRPRPDPAAERLAYSVNEAARLTGLSRDLLYDQMRLGNLPYIKIGRRRLITRHHLEQFIDITPGTEQLGNIKSSAHRMGAGAP
jgi:excisionase family DNA binding protein